MLEASETRSRFKVEDGKIKCNLAGRTRGKRCGSTLMIDGSIVCSAGHKFNLNELAEAALQGKPNALIARTFLAVADENFDLARKLAEVALKDKFSPPFSLPATKVVGQQQDIIYRWMDHRPEQFVLLLQLADWCFPNYAEALRRSYVERSAQNDAVKKALAKLNERAERGDFQSQMLRDHFISCAMRSMNAATVSAKALSYYMLIEAHKINGDTDLLWVYEDSLKELSMMRREPTWHPIVFEDYDANPGRMVFYLYLRRPEIGPEIIDGQVMIRIYDHGDVEFKAYSGMFASSPDNDDVDVAIKRELVKHEGLRGEALRITRAGHVVLRDDVQASKPQWQLQAVKDLRHWLCRLKVESKSK